MALILNLSTGHVSPQYHVVFDDTFSTVSSIGLVPSDWLTLCSTSREPASDENFELSPDWTATSPTRPSIDWLASLDDSEPTTL